MDTKSKKSNPLLSWLGFFIGINLLVASTLGGIYLSQYSKDIMSSDYKDTQGFKRSIYSNFYLLVQSITENQDITWGSSNLSYYGIQENVPNSEKQLHKTNVEIKSMNAVIPFNEVINYFEGKTNEYSYLLIWDGEHFTIKNDNTPLSPSSGETYSKMLTDYQGQEITNLKDSRIILAVKKQFASTTGDIYHSYLEWKYLRIGAVVSLLSFIIGVILLIFSLIKRGSRKEFSKKLAYYSGKVWLEVKILISLFMLMFLTNFYGTISTIIILAILFWWACLMFLDLYVNRIKFFSNNTISWIIKLYLSFEKKKPFQKGMLIRFLLLVSAELLLIFFTLISLISNAKGFSILFISIGIYIFFKYITGYTSLINDIGRIVDHAELIKNGDMDTKLALTSESPMYKTSEDLNHIQTGVYATVQEQLKSERMKIELITNVSHDLKTPLTAIVNYIDLLGQENLQPEHANDYVKVLSKKTARLTALTQDIFDISKAQSGNLELNIEKIDIVELVKQSLAELDEKIKESSLTFKLNLPKEKIYINADGRKLYRVFDNLISNILKYSLENTRVYIDLTEDGDSVSLSFKNIASYEMNMSPEDLIERFARGDEARSTEGSGLGLAIVQSFVSLCGGEFKLNIDGDLFKAIVKFRKI